MKKKIIIALILILAILYSAYNLPLMLNSNQGEIVNLSDTTKIKFNPIADLDFSKGDNVGYLLFSRQDIKELPKEISKFKLLECRDNKTLENLKDNFWFEKTNGDMATCESEIFLYKNGKLVFHTSIAITNHNMGIQSTKTGWADSSNEKELKTTFSKFKPVKRPIVKL